MKLPSTGQSDKFAWTTALDVTKGNSGCHATRKFRWNDQVYSVTVHNPGNTLSKEQMSQAIESQIDKIVILTERYLHSKSVESFECNAQLSELKRVKVGDKGAKTQMPVVQNPFEVLNARKKHAPTDPIPPHIQNALALYDQVKKMGAPQPSAASIKGDQAEIKVEKKEEANDEMKLKDAAKKDEPKNKLEPHLGPFGYLFSKLLPVGQYLRRWIHSIWVKIESLFVKKEAKNDTAAQQKQLAELLAKAQKQAQDGAKAKTS